MPAGPVPAGCLWTTQSSDHRPAPRHDSHTCPRNCPPPLGAACLGGTSARGPHADDVGSAAGCFPWAPAGCGASAGWGGTSRGPRPRPHCTQVGADPAGDREHLPPGGPADTGGRLSCWALPLGPQPGSGSSARHLLELVRLGSELLSVCGAGRGSGVFLLPVTPSFPSTAC